MKFLELELDGFKRTSLTGINRLRYKPVQKTQIITGPNGSGKSSILEQLSPFPADKSDFHPSGMKRVIIEDNGKIYTLINTFGASPKYHFIVDGEDLNRSNNKTTQISLAQSHFHIDQKTWDIVTGKTVFTQMSVSQRRDWFTRASGKDHTYAEYVYKTLSEALRDATGAFKHLSKARAREEENLLSEELSERLRANKEYVARLLSSIQEKQQYSKDDLDTILSKQRQTMTEITKVNGQLRKYLDKRTSKEPIEALNHRLQGLEKETYQVTGKLNQLWEQLQNKKETLEMLKETNSRNTEAIRSKIERLQTALIEQNPIPELSIEDVKRLISVFSNLYETLKEIGEILVETNTAHMCLDNEEKIKSEYEAIERELKEREIKLSGIVSIREMEELRNVSIECPNCNHKWNTNIGELVYRTETIDEEVALEELKKRLVETREVLESITIRKRTISELRRLISNTYIPGLWKYFGAVDEISEDPHFFLSKLERLLVSKNQLPELVKINDKIKKYTLLLDRQQGNSDIAVLEREIIDLTRMEEELTKRKMELEYAMKELKTSIDLEKKILVLVDRLKKLLRTSSTNKKKAKQKAFQNTLSLISSDLKKIIDDYDERIAVDMRSREVMNRITKEIEEVDRRRTLLDLSVKALSPKDGLIGEMITDGMLDILEDMNSIISAIWRYKLEILPCIPEDNEINLSYRFPVLMEDHRSTDISRTSSSMQDIINVAFRITMASRLGLETYPLFLDEFGRSFDTIHRKNAYETIYTELGAAQEISQIFIVSHYMEDFGYYKNCDVAALGQDQLFGKQELSEVLVID